MTKTFAYILLSSIILLVIAIIVSQSIIRVQFQNLARDKIRQKTEMVHRLIDTEIQRLVQINKDWGSWDETYEFVQNKNTAYQKDNLIPSSFITLDIEFIVYYDTLMHIVYSGRYFPEGDTILALDNEIANRITEYMDIDRLRPLLNAGTFTTINRDPYIVSAESILTSRHKGPLLGWLVMARRLDLRPIMDLTGIIIDIQHDDSTETCILKSSPDEHIVFISEKRDSIFAVHRFYDMLNEHMLGVRVREENKILKQGMRTRTYIILAIILLALLNFLQSLLGINALILRPLMQISKQLKTIDLENIERKIILSKTSNEFQQLTENINKMLEKMNSQKEKILESESKYRDLVENAEVGIYIDDVDGNVVYNNDKFAGLFGYQPEEFSKLKFEDFISIDDLKTIRQYHSRRIKGEDVPARYEIKGIHKDGGQITLETNTILIHKDGKVAGTRNYVLNISQRKEIEEKLTAESMTDPLTGLFNRRGFNSLAYQQLELSRKIKKGFYLLYCDLNNMKKFNDKFGHSTGDTILKETAQILKNSFRKSDITARVGGDEFIILATEAQPDSINVMLDRLNKNIEKYNNSENHPNISLSIGYVHFNPEDSKSLEEIIALADKMMYEEKTKFKQKGE